MIVRGWSGDLQIWVPASARLLKEPGDDIESAAVARFPFLSLVWVGLISMLFGALMLPVVALCASRTHRASEAVSQALSQS
ncbi:MAG: hypothetical protein QM805_23850 [Pseudomonas sp.]